MKTIEDRRGGDRAIAQLHGRGWSGRNSRADRGRGRADADCDPAWVIWESFRSEFPVNFTVRKHTVLVMPCPT